MFAEKFENIINEEILDFFNENHITETMDLGYLKLKDLAEIIGRQSPDLDINHIFNYFLRAFQSGGDEEVKDVYKKLTKGNSKIESFRKGWYYLV